jgi:hypothetical protein
LKKYTKPESKEILDVFELYTEKAIKRQKKKDFIKWKQKKRKSQS